MTVRVDELKVWPTKIACFKRGSAHLTADTLEELHAFALTIGLKRAWFQDHPIAPHYDLAPSRHAAALAAGAVFVSAREQAIARIAARRAMPPSDDTRLSAIEREDREAAERRDAVRPRRGRTA